MRTLMFLPLLLALAGPVAAQEPPKIAFTLQGIAFAERDVIVTKKDAYVHILLDLFPYKAKLTEGDKAYAPLAEDLVQAVAKKHPDRKKFKVDLVEFKERDSYDAPVWSSVKIVYRHEYEWPKPPKGRPVAGEKKKAVK